MLEEIKKLMAEKSQTRHYELSLLFIQKKLQLKVSQLTMAQLTELPLNQYLEMERGSTEIAVSAYEEALKKLENNTEQLDWDNTNNSNEDMVFDTAFEPTPKRTFKL